jgi:tol-pal system protein YbgF
MNLLDKPLLSLAAATLFLALISIVGRAESANKDGPRRGRLETQLATPRNELLVAQAYGRPPGEIGDGAETLYPGLQPEGAQQDSASLLIRIGRLESQMRQINGEIEQMQFETRKLQEQLRKFQEDVEFRFRDGGQGAPASNAPQRRGQAPEPQFNGYSHALPQNSSIGVSPTNRRGDAFDPTQDPDAPGAPRPLGSLAPVASTGSAGGRNEGPSPALDQYDPGAPLDLSKGLSRTTGAPAAALSTPGITTPSGTVIAALPNSSKAEFDIALANLKQRAYENAERGFAAFLDKNPRDKLATDAIYYLGESYYLRGRQREAAEQYLKISTQYANSPRAPAALLRLGESLNALGAKDQACATLAKSHGSIQMLRPWSRPAPTGRPNAHNAELRHI